MKIRARDGGNRLLAAPPRHPDERSTRTGHRARTVLRTNVPFCETLKFAAPVAKVWTCSATGTGSPRRASVARSKRTARKVPVTA